MSVYKNDKQEWIKLAIESILCQQGPQISLFIGIDGLVNDHIRVMLSEYSTHHNVSVYPFEENRGLAIVLNELIQTCLEKGFDYIARMDADDISLPDRLEKQLEYLKSHPDIDVVGGAITEIDEMGNSRDKIIVYPETPEECRKFFSRRNPHAHPAVMFRKSFFDKVGHLYRPEYRQNQDTMLWYDGFMAGTRNANIPDVVLQFRMTNSLFKKRRNGWAFAKKQLQDRKKINKDLEYGLKADLFAYAMFVMLVSPTWVKKLAYRLFR